jgi:predicted GNAT family acetyltransferase
MTANYTFSEIPNTDEGRELVRLMRKYLNRSRYKINVYGQYVKDELKGTGVTAFGQKISESKCLRVYLKDEIKSQQQWSAKWEQV